MNDLPVNFYRQESEPRIQKIPLDLGTTCPNRDGALSGEGCLFCSDRSFVPFYCSPDKAIEKQLEEGIKFFSRKYRCDGYLAYFQSNCATYGNREKFFTALKTVLAYPGIDGAVIATRPDCLSDETIGFLADLSQQKEIRLEIGIESLDEATLKRVNRCHTAEAAVNAIKAANLAGIKVCGHIILGFPGENRNTMIAGAEKLSGLSSIKIHHLQIVKGSAFARSFIEGNLVLQLLEPEQYIELVAEFISHLSADIRVERLLNRVPRSLLLAPIWRGLNEIAARKMLVEYMRRKNICQGCQFSGTQLIKN